MHFVPSCFVGYKHNSVRKHENSDVDGRETSNRLRSVGLLGADVQNAKLATAAKKTTMDDFNFLCSNCHSMIHRDVRMALTLEELKKVIKRAK